MKVSKPMNGALKIVESGGSGSTSGKVSWIAEELIGIRTLEERLSRKLNSRPSADQNRMLLDGIRVLNGRVELLDRALEDLRRAGRTT